jgi:hypothetical protein
MDILQGILKEEDLLGLEEAACVALSRLLDEKLAMRIFEYYNTEGVKPEAKEVIDKYLMPVMERLLFSQLAIDRGLVELVSKLNLDDLHIQRVDRKKIIEDLEWLLENKRKLKAFVEPRKKQDYAEFLSGLDGQSFMRVEQNREMFYDRYERSRGLGVGILVKRSQTWEMALKGLKYLEYIGAKGLQNSYLRKEF